MSDSTVPPLPPYEPTPPVKKSRTNLVIMASAAAVIAAVVTTGIVVVQSNHNDSKPAAATTPTSADTATAAAQAPDPTPSYDQVSADSFTIKLKTTSKQCFGSAGCNLTVEPDLTYTGDSSGIDPTAVYEITYEIHGDQSGPVIQTAELSDRTSLNYRPSVISTASSGTKVSVEITDVTTQGG